MEDYAARLIALDPYYFRDIPENTAYDKDETIEALAVYLSDIVRYEKAVVKVRDQFPEIFGQVVVTLFARKI